MLNPIKLEFDTQANRSNIDRTVKYLTIKSRDINTILFEIAFKGVTLDETYAVGLLAVFGNGNQANYVLEIKDGKALYKPDVDLISQYDTVKNYVYLQQGNKSLDVKQFNHRVELSELDKRASVTRKIYDQNYSDLITTFEHSLNDYKENLPQGSELRSEIDAILDKFKTDSDAKLSQYDADAQQVIADNQTAFNLAESDRQATYEQAEDSRNQASEQAITDFGVLADESIGAKLGEIQTDADSAINQFKQDGANEITDWRAENSSELVSLQTEITKKANRKQEEWITPTLLNGATPGSVVPRYYKDEFNVVRFKGNVEVINPQLTIIEMPPGYRPNSPSSAFPAWNFTSRTNTRIHFDGSTRLKALDVSINDIVSLDSLSYRADV